MTAVLPNNAYYVSLDGSRRVTQRTRAHIKPIAIFPIHADDASSGRLQPVVRSDASITQPRVLPVPVATEDDAVGTTPPVEPAHAPENVADNADDAPFEVKREIDGPPARFSSSSPVLRRRGRHAHPATVSQPAPRPPVPSRLAPAGDGIVPKRQRGRPRKTPAPQRIAKDVLDAGAESAADAARRLQSVLQRPPRTQHGNRGSCSVASTMLTSARKRAQARAPTPMDIRRINRKLRALVL